jgi:excisionase family DNA binding protein
MSDELLTVSEVAGRLNVNRGTVVRWIRLGQLKALRLPSGTYRIPRAELDRLLKQLDDDQQ